MQDFENAVAAPTPGGAAGGKAALNSAAVTAAPTPRSQALGELKTNANAALTPAAAAAPLGAHPQQKQKVQMHAPLQRPPTGKPPVAPLSQQQQKKATGVTIQTANAAVAAPSPSLLRLPPVERPAGMPLDQQLAAEELRAQGLAHAAAQAICAGVPLSMPISASRYSSKKKGHLGPAAAAAAAARTFTVFGEDDDEDEECCRPSSAPSTPPAESRFFGEEEQQDFFATSPPSLDDALASLELAADRGFEGEGDEEKSGGDGGGERGASAWAVSPPRDASSE